MDLYNNELGRRIATENPEASPEELARLVYEAVEDGEAPGHRCRPATSSGPT